MAEKKKEGSGRNGIWSLVGTVCIKEIEMSSVAHSKKNEEELKETFLSKSRSTYKYKLYQTTISKSREHQSLNRAFRAELPS